VSFGLCSGCVHFCHCHGCVFDLRWWEAEKFLLEEMVFSYNVNKDVTLVLFCIFFA
jgi:hypothetical protein